MRMVPVIKTSDLGRSIRFYTGVLDFTWKWPEYAEAEIANGVADLTMEGADLQLSRHAGNGVFGSLRRIFVWSTGASPRRFRRPTNAGIPTACSKPACHRLFLGPPSTNEQSFESAVQPGALGFHLETT